MDFSCLRPLGLLPNTFSSERGMARCNSSSPDPYRRTFPGPIVSGSYPKPHIAGGTCIPPMLQQCQLIVSPFGGMEGWKWVGERKSKSTWGGTGVGFYRQILSSTTGSIAKHRAVPVFASGNADREWSSPIVGALPECPHWVPSALGKPVAAVAPAGSSNRHFGTAAPMGARQLWIGLPLTLFAE